MIAKILAKGATADIVGYVMREFHDKEQFTPDTWRVIDSDGVLGDDYRRVVDSFDIGASLNKRISKPIGHIAMSLWFSWRKNIWNVWASGTRNI